MRRQNNGRKMGPFRMLRFTTRYGDPRAVVREDRRCRTCRQRHDLTCLTCRAKTAKPGPDAPTRAMPAMPRRSPPCPAVPRLLNTATSLPAVPRRATPCLLCPAMSRLAMLLPAVPSLLDLATSDQTRPLHSVRCLAAPAKPGQTRTRRARTCLVAPRRACYATPDPEPAAPRLAMPALLRRELVQRLEDRRQFGELPILRRKPPHIGFRIGQQLPPTIWIGHHRRHHPVARITLSVRRE